MNISGASRKFGILYVKWQVAPQKVVNFKLKLSADPLMQRASIIRLTLLAPDEYYSMNFPLLSVRSVFSVFPVRLFFEILHRTATFNFQLANESHTLPEYVQTFTDPWLR